MFEVNNDVAKIDGSMGKYDKTVTNPSVRYGKNAVNNYYSYMEQPLLADNKEPAPILDFSPNPDAAEKNIEKLDKFVKDNDAYLNALPPLEFEYRYMPNIHKKGEVNTQSVLASAYEELGRRKEVSVEDVDRAFAINSEFSSEPIDLNKDGKIDAAEYGTTILAADMFSKSDTPDTSNIDGTINSKGLNKILEYTHKSNAEAAANLYSNLYNQYNLGEAYKNFNPEG